MSQSLATMKTPDGTLAVNADHQGTVLAISGEQSGVVIGRDGFGLEAHVVLGVLGLLLQSTMNARPFTRDEIELARYIAQGLIEHAHRSERALAA